MRNFRILLSLIGVFVWITACQTSTSKKDPASWPDKMQKMSKAVSKLMPYVYSRNEFHKDDNYKVIKKQIQSFASAVHEVPSTQGQKMTGDDPMIKFNLQRLKSDINRAEKGFVMGQKEYSRSLLRNAVGHCFSCHSRTSFGPEYTISTSNFKKVRLNPTEKADIYVATRQYDKALKVLKAKLNDPISYYEDPFELERALKKYLAITVRIKKTPALAIDTIDKFLERKNIPFYLAEDAKRWKKSLRQWMGEKSDAPTLGKVKVLMKRGSNQQSTYSFQSGHIEYLRASQMLHDLLRDQKKASGRANVLSMLGKSYETLSDLGFWNLPEVYYEACVREYPKSKTAKKCYKEFEKNIIFGFSGSAGVLIPADERARLEELKQISGL